MSFSCDLLGDSSCFGTWKLSLGFYSFFLICLKVGRFLKSEENLTRRPIAITRLGKLIYLLEKFGPEIMRHCSHKESSSSSSALSLTIYPLYDCGFNICLGQKKLERKALEEAGMGLIKAI